MFIQWMQWLGVLTLQAKRTVHLACPMWVSCAAVHRKPAISADWICLMPCWPCSRKVTHST